MIDARITPITQALLIPLVRLIDKFDVKPDQVSLLGFIIGLCAVPAIIFQWWALALTFILLNRIFDGVDGALARHQQSTSSAGGFLDISLDFLFYAAIPLAFGISEPVLWGTAALVLVTVFIGTGSSFLAFAIAAEKYNIERPQFKNKSFYYMQGLTEGTETILVFIAFCLWPQYFSIIAYIFSAACAITVVTRIWGGYQTLRDYEEKSEYSCSMDEVSAHINVNNARVDRAELSDANEQSK